MLVGYLFYDLIRTDFQSVCGSMLAAVSEFDLHPPIFAGGR
jgi:hypothetical protein